MARVRQAAAVVLGIGVASLTVGAGPRAVPPLSTTARVAQTSQTPALDPDAMAMLDKMGSYLRTLTAFQVQSTTSREDVLDDGQKIATDGTVDLLVQRPNRLRVEIQNDARHRMFFYDGKSFTMWARLVNYYASVPAPPTLAELVDVLNDKYDIELPLADLFYWGTDKAKVNQITSAIDVGPSQVGGVSCEHLAFRQDGIDWQLWLQSGAYPLPRKLVITTTSDDAKPQYTSVLTWNLAPAFDNEAFMFDPPADAHKISIQEVK
jgi:hypothetical protein